MARKNINTHKSANQRAEMAARRTNLENEVRTMAQQANRRLRALERHDLTSASNAYRYIERRHFDKDTAIAQDRSGRIKFDTALKKKSAQQLQHEKRQLEIFLYEAKTSTVKGTNERYTRMFETMKKKYPKQMENISRATFDTVARAEGFKAFVKSYGSSQMFELLNKYSEAKNEMAMEAIKEALAKRSDKMTLDEFYKSALPPTEWVKNDAQIQDSEIPDASAYGYTPAEDEEEGGWMPLDEFLKLQKKGSPRKGGRKGGRRK